MKLIDAVNQIMPILGEHPVNNLDTKHPTLAVILPAVDLKLIEVLSRGWWFNEYQYTLRPDSEGFIYMPVDTLAFIPDQQGPVVRGRRLFNTRTNNFKFTEQVPGTLQVTMEFDDLPTTVAVYVFYTTLVHVYLTDIGLENTVGEWKEMADNAEAQATSEHLRNKRYSTKHSRRFGNLRRHIRG